MPQDYLGRSVYHTAFLCSNVLSILSERQDADISLIRNELNEAIGYLSSMKKGVQYFIDRKGSISEADVHNCAFLSNVLGQKIENPELSEQLGKYIDTLERGLTSPNTILTQIPQDQLEETRDFFDKITTWAEDNIQERLYQDQP